MGSLKQFAWFVLKAPQRNWVGYGSLLTDLKAWFSRQFAPKSKDTIWVCVGTYNRSHQLLNSLLPSLAKANKNGDFGLSVFDGGSTDIENLHAALEQVWPGPLKFSSEPLPFARAVFFNRAIAQSGASLFFACDADMQVPENLSTLIYRYVKGRSAWFPICQWQINAQSSDWRWFTEGTGNFAATMNQFKHTGWYDESFTGWGKEDWDLFFRFYKKGFAPFRTHCKGLYHTWHPATKPADYQNMF